jgi:hypothetical protein
MKPAPRQATRNDIPGMHAVRLAVRENRLTTGAITEAHYIPAIESSGRGWVIEKGADLVAFAVGNSETVSIRLQHVTTDVYEADR